MKLRARYEADNESKLSLEKGELGQSARDERGTREREREECSACLRVQCLRVERDKQRGFMANVNEDFLKHFVCFFFFKFYFA
jgi:hypothetical protein